LFEIERTLSWERLGKDSRKFLSCLTDCVSRGNGSLSKLLVCKFWS
jgi:hypothetical protein